MILPASGWLLIETIEPEIKTKSGVFLSQSAKEQEELYYGHVVAIGKPEVKEGGVVAEPPSFVLCDKEGNPKQNHKLETGDTVMFRNRTQHEIGYDDLAFLRFESVLGLKLKEEK